MLACCCWSLASQGANGGNVATAECPLNGLAETTEVGVFRVSLFNDNR